MNNISPGWMMTRYSVAFANNGNLSASRLSTSMSLDIVPWSNRLEGYMYFESLGATNRTSFRPQICASTLSPQSTWYPVTVPAGPIQPLAVFLSLNCDKSEKSTSDCNSGNASKTRNTDRYPFGVA